MSELKSFIVLYDGKFIRAYEEKEADKVIANLEESHKKEVGQLLIEIAEQKSEIERLEILCANYRHDCDNLAISNEQVKFCGDRGQFAFKKPSELKDGVRLTRYPRVRFDMCTFIYKETK